MANDLKALPYFKGLLSAHRYSKITIKIITIEEGEYPTSVWSSVATLYGLCYLRYSHAVVLYCTCMWFRYMPTSIQTASNEAPSIQRAPNNTHNTRKCDHKVALSRSYHILTTINLTLSAYTGCCSISTSMSIYINE